MLSVIAHKQWAAANLRVGGYPNPTDLDPSGPLSGFDIFLNVSDELKPAYELQVDALGKKHYWFPQGETRGTMSLASLFGAITVLWRAQQRGQRVYLHCHAGVNRSQVTADCFHYLMNEQHRPLQFQLIGTYRAGSMRNQLEHNCHYGVLPPLAEMENWLLRVANELPRLDGGSFDYSKPPVFV